VTSYGGKKRYGGQTYRAFQERERRKRDAALLRQAERQRRARVAEELQQRPRRPA
jgi:hypothetical protein